MRLLGYALVVVLCSLSVALAAPNKGKAGGKAPPPVAATRQVDPKLAAELTKLDAELTQHMTKQAFVPAARVARRLYELQVKATGEGSPEAQRRKQTLASMLSTAGDYAGAEKLYRELLKATEKEKGAESREVLYALMAMTGPYWQQSRYDELEPLLQRQLAITRKLDGEKSQAYAQALGTLGALHNIKNEYSAAQRVYEQALQIHEAIAKGPDDWMLISPIQVLANLHWTTNQQAKAIALYDRAIKISETSKDIHPTMKTMTPWAAAMTYFYGGRKDLAAPLIKRTIALLEADIAQAEKTKPDDWSIPSLYGQVGNMYRQAGEVAKAEQAFEKAISLAAKKKTYSGQEAVLADLKREQGKLKEALALYERAQAELTKMAPKSSTAYNITMADLLRELGDHRRAEQLLDAARDSAVRQWGKKHIMYGSIQMSSTWVYAAGGKLALAEKALDEGLDWAERELANVLRTGTDADHAVYFARYGYVLDAAINYQLNFAPRSGSAARLALTTLLRRKGRVLDAAAASLATIRKKLSPGDKALLDELNSARAQLAKLTVAGPSATGDEAEYAKEVAALESKIQRLELQISKKSAAYRTVTQPIELSAIQKVIPADAKLIEIVNYQPHDPKASYAMVMAGKLKPRRYAAYVVGPKGDPVSIDLGDAIAIDQAIERFRKALADPDNDMAADLGRSLHDLTMAKIVPALGTTTNLLIAPDGSLNVVPFSALVDDKKQFLIKKYTFTYLTSGRDLLRLSVKTKAQGGGVLFADPQFDSAKSSAAGSPSGKTRGRRSADLASLKWPQLPGTAAEADAVTKTFKGLKVFRGDEATENALKSVSGPKILHLATHGFFLPDEKPAETVDPSRGAAMQAGPGGPGGMAGPGANASPQAVENPLLRSGLALAGANKLESGEDDGVLTALEASGLDLWGTKLVVLSACETGVGKVSNGDGVYGLRRSLVIAGAESLVMSLWQVDDFATKELMAGFYKKLATGKPRSAALRETQLELLAKDKYAHPFYWASFLPAGATTPLKD